MDTSTSPSATLDKGLALLTAIARDDGRASLADHADRLGLPRSTARRLATALRRQGFIASADRGHYVAGPVIAELAAACDPGALLIRSGRGPLRRLARTLRTTVHLAVLEADMVTYLVKEHHATPPLFTRERKQLEAYCSGLGKVLLAHLPTETRDAYLDGGPFVALTRHTIVDPHALRAELDRVRACGFAIDRGEIDDGLYCVAVPVRRRDGTVVAAVSASSRQFDPDDTALVVDRLQRCATLVAGRLDGRPSPNRPVSPTAR